MRRIFMFWKKNTDLIKYLQQISTEQTFTGTIKVLEGEFLYFKSAAGTFPCSSDSTSRRIEKNRCNFNVFSADAQQQESHTHKVSSAEKHFINIVKVQ